MQETLRNKFNRQDFTPRRFLTFYLVLALLVLLISPRFTEAAALTTLSDTMSRLKISENSNHTIKFTTPSGATDIADTIEITMPAGFTIGAVVFGDMDLSHGVSTGYETELTLGAAAGAGVWGASFAGQILSLDHPTDATGDIALGDKVIVEIGTNAAGGSNQITNNSSADSYVISIAGDFGDDGKIGIVTLTDDQFTISGTVDPILTFSLSGTSTGFGTFSDTSVVTSTPNIVLTIGTNATNGYTISIYDTGDTTNPGLYSSGNSFTIGSADYSYNNTADLSSVAGYGIQGSSGDATIDARYDQSGDNVGGYELTAQALATYGSAADGHTVTITSKSKVTSSTPAGDYDDSVTVIATGNF